MGRSVTDIAILLGVLQSPFGEVIGISLPERLHAIPDSRRTPGRADRTRCSLFRLQLLWKRDPGDEATVAFAENALDCDGKPRCHYCGYRYR